MKRKRRLWLVCIAGIGVLAAGLWAAWPRERLLLEDATPILKTTSEKQDDVNWVLGCQWLSDQELLYERFDSRVNGSRRHICRHNIVTGTEAEIPGLVQMLTPIDGERVDAQVSPDGKWLVCAARFNVTFLFALDGSRHIVYPPDGSYRHVEWLADSRRWLDERSWHEESVSYLRDVEKPQAQTELKAWAKLDLSYRTERIFSPERVLISRGIDDEHPSETRQIQFFQTTLETPQNRKPLATIMLPRDREYQAHCVSPSGDRIAWIFHEDYHPPMNVFLHRLFPSIQERIEGREELWGCKLDGSNMHCLGYIPLEQSSSSDFMWELQWRPGGKRLSFGYHDTLYTVPVD